MRRALRQHKTDNLQFGAGQPVHHDPDPQHGDPAGRRLRRHRDVGRSLPLAIRPITAAFTADSAGIFDRRAFRALIIVLKLIS